MDKEIILETETSQLWVIKNFTPDYMDLLKEVVVQQEPLIQVFGRPCHQRRDIAFYSNESVGYTYSRTLMPSFPLNQSPAYEGTTLFEYLLPYVNEQLGTHFNGILVNRYRDGNKYISAHSDDESGLAENNLVVGISYGAPRIFRIRHKKTKKIVLDYSQESSSLLGMSGDFQKEFTHEIPIQKKIKEERISLTFRSHRQ